MEIKLHLHIGEKDGAKPVVEMASRPRLNQIFYTWRTCDDERIREARNPKRREALIENLSVLAYKFDGQTITREAGQPMEWRFNRWVSADKVVSDPAV